jgi:spore coat polysaccharide biosynthesis protein SpsF
MSERAALAAADRPVVCITQARMGSTRLPGKVMLPAAGRPLLYWHLSRLARAQQIDRLIVATTTEAQDDAIAVYGASLGCAVFRGSEHDVLSRYAGAAEAFGAMTVVRVTSDCPLIDPDLVDEAIIAYGRQRPGVDYLSLDIADLPRGLDAEVFSSAALMTAQREAAAAYEREHVTPFLYRRPERFRCAQLTIGAGHGDLRWCVDEPADYELVRRIIEGLAPAKPAFTWRDCLAVLEAHPDWAALNRHVKQRQPV